MGLTVDLVVYLTLTREHEMMVSIAALQRILGRKQEKEEQFQSISCNSFSKGG